MCKKGKVIREKSGVRLVECVAHGGYIVTVFNSAGGYHYKTKAGGIQGWKKTLRAYEVKKLENVSS